MQMRHFELRIAGQELDTKSNVEIRSPYDQSLVGTHSLAGPEQVETAITFASTRLAHWRGGAWSQSYQRRNMLTRLVTLLEKNRDTMARLITSESGKPIQFALGEVDRAISTTLLGAEESTRIHGENLSLDVSSAAVGKRGVVSWVPSGPIVAFSPFNFPLNLVCHKVIPALALGAPVVLKPAPQAPLSALFFQQLVYEAGAPEGALCVLPCSNELAQKMVQDDRFSVFSFTGSDRVGYFLKESARKKRVLLELGGNAAAIVLADADIERVVKESIVAAFAYAGQVCISLQRLFVDKRIASEVRQLLQTRIKDISVQDPHDTNTLLGPMIDDNAAKRVESWAQEAVEQGATLSTKINRDQNKLDPIVLHFDGSGVGCKVVDEEVFGPVLTMHEFDKLEQAIAWTNQSKFGLQASIYTDSVSAIKKAYADIDVAALIVNGATTFRVDSMPYGGVKDSGLGREGIRYAIEEYAERKMLVLLGKVIACAQVHTSVLTLGQK